MHIPDGYLGPKTYISCFAVMAPLWGIAWKQVSKHLSGHQVSNVALAAAFIFVIMMFNVPLPGGTSGHAVGSSLAAIALGAMPALLATSFALILQAVVFGDGGITAIAANCFNMGVVQVFVSLYFWHLLRPRDLLARRSQTNAAAFAAGFFGILAAAFTTAIMFGLQPTLERDPVTGAPLYAPFPMAIALQAMMIPHLLAGVIEGGITSAAVLALARASVLDPTITAQGYLGPAAALYRRRTFWLSSVVFVLMVPAGLFLPAAFKAGDAWGEWAPEDIPAQAAQHGMTLNAPPTKLEKVAAVYNAPIPDYAFSETKSLWTTSFQYVAAAFLGVIITVAFFLVLRRSIPSNGRKPLDADSAT